VHRCVLFVLFAGTCLWLAAGATAEIYEVHPDGGGDFASIQAAIDHAITGDTILLADGTFAGPGNRDLDFLGKAITVRSISGDPQACTIDCGGSSGAPHRGVLFQSGETAAAVLEGIGIHSGLVSGEAPHQAGGGILCLGASPTLTNLVISGCTAGDGEDGTGGGMYCESSGATLTGVTFSSNQAGGMHRTGHGGGLYAKRSTLLLEQVEFTGNTAGSGYGSGYGGGLYADSCEIDVQECRFASNTAGSSDYGSGAGGGCYASHSTVVLESSRFESNHTQDIGAGAYLHGCAAIVLQVEFVANSAGFPSGAGGGLYVSEPQLTWIREALFAENYVYALGGGLYCEGNPPIERCTFCANATAFGDPGAAIYCQSGTPEIEDTIVAFHPMGIPLDGGTPVLSCCDVYGNADGDYVGSIAGQEAVRDNFSLDPLFCDASAEDFRLQEDSPCSGGVCVLVGAYGAGCEDPGAVGADSPQAAGWALADPVPNPFTVGSRLDFQVPQGAGARRLSLSIHDAAGRAVRLLTDGPREAGAHSQIWDGRDDAGRDLPNGVYYVRLAAGAITLSRRAILIR